MQRSLHVETILAISPNGELLRRLTWALERAGFAVRASGSLQEAFLDTDPHPAGLIIVDSDALRDVPWQAEEFLRWFHRRSPILLLRNQEEEAAVRECDQVLPKNTDPEQLVRHIQRLPG